MDVRRHVDLDREVDVADVDEALAERPGHRRVELDDDGLRGPDRGVHRLDARPERAEAVASGGVALTNTTSSGSAPRLEQPRDVRQEDRHVVGPALVDGGPRVRPDEQRPMPEVALHLRREVRARALGVEVDDRDVVELLGARDEGVEEHGRRRGRAVEVDPIAGGDDARGVSGRDEAHDRKRTVRSARRRRRQPDRNAVTFGPVRAGDARGVSLEHETTSTSDAFEIRPIGPDDCAALERFYAGLSRGQPRGPVPRLRAGASTEAAAAFFCGPDHLHREGLVAEVAGADGDREIIGHVCLEPCRSAERAEIAVAVADAWQRHGRRAGAARRPRSSGPPPRHRAARRLDADGERARSPD